MTDIDPLTNPKLDDALGGLRRGRKDDDRVYHPDKAIIIHEDGTLNREVKKAKESHAQADAKLWNRIGPLRYGDIILRKNTEVWHEERSEWWKATKINVYDDGEPKVMFRIKGTDPIQHITLTGQQLADRVSDGILISKDEKNYQLETELGL